jgi:hypothetical protein
MGGLVAEDGEEGEAAPHQHEGDDPNDRVVDPCCGGDQPEGLKERANDADCVAGVGRPAAVRRSVGNTSVSSLLLGTMVVAIPGHITEVQSSDARQ